MFNRKKYRKNKEYFFFASGIKRDSTVLSAIFSTVGTLTLTKSLDSFEMYNEVMIHVKRNQNIPDTDGSFALYTYYVESL